MSGIVAKYGFRDMNPNEKYRIELDGSTSRGELRAAARRFAAKHGYGVQVDRGEGNSVYVKFTKAAESWLIKR